MASYAYFDYPNLRRVVYESKDGDRAHFIPVCPMCGRFVKSDDKTTFTGEGQPTKENATCSKCGRVAMPFEGYP